MKTIRYAFVSLATVLGMGASAAATNCPRQLQRTWTPGSGELSLPPACRAIGPVHLGMTVSQVSAVMGPPNARDVQIVGHAAAHVWVYVLPLDLAAALERRPLPPAQVRFGVFDVMFNGKTNRVVSIYIRADPSKRYDVDGIRLGQNVDTVIGQIGSDVPMHWNTPGDFAWVGAGRYPLTIAINRASRSIEDIGIATNNSYIPIRESVRVLFTWNGRAVKNWNAGVIVNGFRVIRRRE